MRTVVTFVRAKTRKARGSQPVYGLLPVVKQVAIMGLRVGCGRISGLYVEAFFLLANMDSRSPRANRGAGV